MYFSFSIDYIPFLMAAITPESKGNYLAVVFLGKIIAANLKREIKLNAHMRRIINEK